MRLHASEPGQVPRAGLRALVVDDSVFDRQHIARVCAALRIATEDAACVDEAVERLRGARYDIAIVDHRLGAESGCEVAALLDRSTSADALRILLTGNEDPRIAAEAGRYRFVHCLAKGQLDAATLARLVAPLLAPGAAR